MMVGVVKILVKHIKGVHSEAALILFRDIDLRQKVVGQTGLYPAYHINVGIFFYVINKEFKLRVLCSGFVNVLRLCVKSGRAFGKRVCVKEDFPVVKPRSVVVNVVVCAEIVLKRHCCGSRSDSYSEIVRLLGCCSKLHLIRKCVFDAVLKASVGNGGKRRRCNFVRISVLIPVYVVGKKERSSKPCEHDQKQQQYKYFVCGQGRFRLFGVHHSSS